MCSSDLVVGKNGGNQFFRRPGLFEPAGNPDGNSVVDAEGLSILKPQQVRQLGVVSELWMHIQGQMTGVKPHVSVEQGSDALQKGAFDPGGGSPEHSVVDEKKLRPGFRGPANGCRAGVHREGYLGQRFFRSPYLDAVQGVVDSTKLIDLQKRAAPEVKIGKRHGWSI